MRWRPYVALSLWLGVSFVPSQAAACSCSLPPAPLDALVEAEAVFTGFVTSLRQGRDGMLGGELTAELRVSRLWKGTLRTTYVVSTAEQESACGRSFRLGTEYLVYAYGDPSLLATSLCTRTAPWSPLLPDRLLLPAPVASLRHGSLEPSLESPAQLVAHLNGRQHASRTVRALLALAARQGSSPKAVAAIAEVLRAGETRERRTAAWALGHLQAPDAQGPSALARALGDSSPLVALEAARSLSLIGPRAAGAVPSLRAVLTANRRAEVLRQLDRLTAGQRNRERALRAELNAAEELIQVAAGALGSIGPAAAPAVPDLLPLLPHLRPDTLTSLTRIGEPFVTPAVAELRAGLRSSDRRLGCRTCYALAALGSTASAAIPDLLALLEEGEREDRAGAARALGKIAPSDPEVRHGLEKLHADPDEWVRSSAAEALGPAPSPIGGTRSVGSRDGVSPLMEGAFRLVGSVVRLLMEGPTAAATLLLLVMAEAARRSSRGGYRTVLGLVVAALIPPAALAILALGLRFLAARSSFDRPTPRRRLSQLSILRRPGADHDATMPRLAVLSLGEGRHIGQRMAGAGERVVVGDFFTDAVHLLSATDGTLLKTAAPVPDRGFAEKPYFGTSVSAVRDGVAVGAPQWSGATGGSGAVWLYDADLARRPRRLTSPRPQWEGHFGTAIAQHAGKVLVGAPREHPNGSETGAAYLFDRRSGRLLWEIANPDPKRCREFGAEVALGNRTAAVTAGIARDRRPR